jgi:hypothetical protein
VETQTPIFVVSSGRAGSTLLARMIHRHPKLLCISDLFEPVGDVPYFDRQHVVSGPEFFRILSLPSFPQRIQFWRERPTSELLHLPDDDNMVSLLATYTLPFVTGGDPMELYGELEVATATFGEATMADHMIRFFDWLRDRYGAQKWVERTGGSLPHARKIVETWPHAKIVHNYRDCRETAISMLSGSFFKLYLELEKNPNLGDWDSEVVPPVEEMGAMLNRWVVDAVAAFETLPAEQWMNLSFEDLLADAQGSLVRLACFLLDQEEATPEDVAWAEEQSELIRPPSLKFKTRPPEEQEKLQSACREGLETLGYL